MGEGETFGRLYYIMILDQLGTTFTFQTFDDKKSKRPELVAMLHGTFTEHRAELTRLNKLGAGIFYTVNETDLQGRQVSNIKRVRALFVDLDTPDINRTFDFYLPPSAVIESSPGKHQCYWFLADELPLSDFRQFQKALAEMLGGDPKIIDLPRVLRVPGFLHQKNEPFRVREALNTGKRYAYQELKHWIIGDDPVTESRPADPVDKITPHIADDPDALTELTSLLDRLAQAGEGERNNTLNLVAYGAYGLWRAGRLAKDFITTELLAVALDIGLEEAEALTTMRSARKKAVPVYNDLDMLPELPKPSKDAPTFGLQMARGSDLSIRATRWLWDGWLARGEMHILGGAPSTGKTTITLSMAATMSTGGRWPDDSICIQRNVVIWSGEDSFETTLGPRLIKSGANLNNIYFIQGVLDASGKRPFDPAKDMKYLHEKMAAIGNIGLLIVDPIISAVSGDSHKNNEVRRGLQPLCDLGRAFNCAVVGITHLTKGTQGKDPVERLTGSIAFGALARVVFMAVKTVDADNNVSRIFVRAKSNIGKDDGGFNYELHLGLVPGHPEINTTSVQWGDWIDGHARDILGDSEQSNEDRSSLDDAKQFLRGYLEDGPRDSKSVLAEARRVQISRSTLQRARMQLKIKVSKHGFTKGAGWQWEFPFEPIS